MKKREHCPGTGPPERRRTVAVQVQVTLSSATGCNPIHGYTLLSHFGHLAFADSCSLMVSVRSNDLPHSLQRY
jgi:hypothetical protein